MDFLWEGAARHLLKENSMKRFRVGLVGANGYTGMEMLRLLTNHPRLILTRATARADAGGAGR